MIVFFSSLSSLTIEFSFGGEFDRVFLSKKNRFRELSQEISFTVEILLMADSSKGGKWDSFKVNCFRNAFK